MPKPQLAAIPASLESNQFVLKYTRLPQRTVHLTEYSEGKLFTHSEVHAEAPRGQGKAAVPAAATRKALAAQQEATAQLQARVQQLEGMAARNAKDKVIAAQVLCCAVPCRTSHYTS